MIEEYEPMDRRHDDSYERFMEKRFQKINSPGQSSMEDSLPFPIEPLRTAPVTLPQKRVSNTSSDSLFHFLLNLFVQLRLLFHRNELVILAVILELTLLRFCHQQCQ